MLKFIVCLYLIISIISVIRGDSDETTTSNTQSTTTGNSVESITSSESNETLTTSTTNTTGDSIEWSTESVPLAKPPTVDPNDTINSNENISEDKKSYGCWKPWYNSDKYCWKYCEISSNTFMNKWCYTKNPKAEPKSRIPCKTADECDESWDCFEECARFFPG